jgi:hypothetical protein
LRVLDYLIYRGRYTAEFAGPASLLLLGTLFLYSGALLPQSIPDEFSSSQQLTGLVLLLILTPSFLATYLVIAQRRSIDFVEKLVASRLATADTASKVRETRGRIVIIGTLLGFLYGLLLNLPPEWRDNLASLDVQVRSIVIGQVILWTLVGFVLAYRLHTALVFYGTGKRVPLDLYDTSKYAPFAKNGLDDVFGITILLVLTTVQSLDVQFRLENYLTAWVIAFPAGASLLILPMLSLHRRLFEHKREFLEAMNRQLADASGAVEPESLARIELLMQHRDRIQHTSAWPIDLSIVTRLILYIIIPPLAWLGAAVVEVGVDRLLSGP